MNGRYLPFGSTNPLAQIVSLVVFGVVLVGAVIMGAFVLMAVLGLAVLGFIVITLRAWWLRRTLARKFRDGVGPGSPGRPATSIRYIEAEYEVVDPDAERRPRRRERP